MTFTIKTMTAAAALGLMSGAAFADTDMTCGDFMAMDSEGQIEAMGMIQGPDGGRDSARAEANGATEASGGEAVSSSSADDEMNQDSGQEGQQDMARGDDDEMMAAVLDHCKGGDELLVKDVVPGDGMGQ
ncbi:hypothetical protein [Roseovarius aquimarinus]|uniref:HdeA/HdeB family protein n=1 Tax=Roseovarius aquimarinus TaxID=1229156 RepID=A0ABW7I7Y2_9RHOB